MKRKSIGCLIIGILIGMLLSTAISFADEQIVEQTKQKITIMFNNIELQDSEAILYNDKTYVPVRVIAEKLNVLVTYNAETQTVSLNEKPIEGKTTVKINGQIKQAEPLKSPYVDPSKVVKKSSTTTKSTVTNTTNSTPTNTTIQSSTPVERVKTKAELKVEKINQMIKSIPTGNYLVTDEEVPVYRVIPEGYYILPGCKATGNNLFPKTKTAQEIENQ
jgi:hypothetical protein